MPRPTCAAATVPNSHMDLSEYAEGVITVNKKFTGNVV